MIFGLSREIPNFDVLLEDEGAFSPAYHVFTPKNAALGVMIGLLMRFRLMEQTDILKRGAREGRTLDKEKLLRKQFSLPNQEEVKKLWEGV